MGSQSSVCNACDTRSIVKRVNSSTASVGRCPVLVCVGAHEVCGERHSGVSTAADCKRLDCRAVCLVLSQNILLACLSVLWKKTAWWRPGLPAQASLLFVALRCSFVWGRSLFSETPPRSCIVLTQPSFLYCHSHLKYTFRCRFILEPLSGILNIYKIRAVNRI